MAEPVLDVRDLKVEADLKLPGQPFRTVALVDGVSFTLERGRVLGLIGESGAGKSTIGLSTLAYGRGGARIVGGEIRLGGRDILSSDARGWKALRGRGVCYVAQSAAAAFNPAHRLMDQVVEAANHHRVATRAEAERRAIDLFRRLSLPEPERIGQRFPHQVSGGQLQRIMTAMALCSQPDLIVFDEPTTALDVTTQLDVLAAIRDVISQVGVSALYITHDLPVVSQIADDILVLRHGKVVEAGPARQIVEQPRNDYTRALVSVHHQEQPQRNPRATSLLSTSGICAAYGGSVKVLEQVSIDVSAGRTLAVVGESGSGKSTLARVLTGLLPPSEGAITFDDMPLARSLFDRSKEDLRRIQLIHQSPDVSLNPRQTIGAIIGRPVEFYFGLRGAERDRRVAELLDKMELAASFAWRYPGELSGGQKQRICVARALAAKPSLVICDEMTSALDPLVANGVLGLIRKLQAEEGVSYVFITHDIGVVRAIADTIAVMHRGRVVRYGPRDHVLSPPFDPYTASLLASVPELRVDWLDDAMAKKRGAGVGAHGLPDNAAPPARQAISTTRDDQTVDALGWRRRKAGESK